MTNKDKAIIVLAAGSGERFGGLKQFKKINEKVILFQTVETLLSYKIASCVVIVVPEGKISSVKKKFKQNSNIFVVVGGHTRSESTKNGLDVLVRNKSIKYVYIHDGVRPFVNKKIFTDLYRVLLIENSKGAVTFLPVTDSVIMINDKDKNVHLDKNKVITTQTPHLYILKSLYACFLENSVNNKIENAEMMELFGNKVSYVLGPKENIKLTYKNDLSFFKKLKIT